MSCFTNFPLCFKQNLGYIYIYIYRRMHAIAIGYRFEQARFQKDNT